MIYGGIAAKLVGEQDYESVWKKTIGGELRLHLLLRRLLNRTTPKGLDRLFTLINEHKSVLEKEGDMDSAKQTVAAFIKKPDFMLSLAKNSPQMLLDLI